MTGTRLALDAQHRDQLLKQVFRLALLILLVGFVAAVFLFSIRAVTAIVIAGLLMFVGELLRRQGRHLPARTILLLVMLSLITVLASIGEGSDDSVVFFMAPVMMLTGLITNRREFWCYSALGGAILFGIAVAESRGWIRSGFASLSEQQQLGEPFILLLAHVATCLLVDVLLRGIGNFVVSVRDELEQESLNWHQAAMTDPLTGLLNRRGFLDHADWQLQRAILERSPIALMVLDVDHFKQINDQHGHDVGDIVLQEMARRLKLHLRASDATARLGGEEFCALLTGIHREGAIAVADRFRQQLSERPITVSHGEVSITVSIGLSISLEGRLGIKDLLQEADQALYQAKRSGRNRVVVADEETDGMNAGEADRRSKNRHTEQRPSEPRPSASQHSDKPLH